MTLDEKLKNLSDRPGVYLMKNARGRVIYVGKAKSLLNRVRSYFQSTPDPDPRKAQMAGLIADFETIVTASEMEAFILESNLIKKHKPRYNVVLRDDKNYPYLKLAVNEEFPSLCVVRKVEKDGALYFGPFVPTAPMWETLKFINRIFTMRKCTRKGVGQKLERPCLQFGMKRCSGPCGEMITKEEYWKMVEEVRMFLSGKDKELIRNLEARMKETAQAQNFEAAANIRDRIYALRQATQSQRITSPRLEDRDIIAVAKEGSAADIQALFVRGGKIVGRKDFYFADALEMTEGELLTDFINQFYSGGKEVPPEALISHELPEQGLVEDFLREMRGKNVSLYSPQRGSGRQVMEVALDNARESLRQNLKTDSGRELTLLALKSELRLKKMPVRIEAFDISNTGGHDACGSMVSFELCQPNKSGYRHFNIRTVPEANDFAMMEEVVTRRYKRLMEEGEEWPDLIMVDGGKGQLSAAVEALRDIGADVDNLDIVGLAKAKEKGLKFGGGIREANAFERVYKPYEAEPKVLSPTSAAVNLLAAVRDESHRFAITQHRKLRNKKGLQSPLDDIEGIGKKRKTQLLRHFGSFRAIREAAVEDLEKVPRLPKKVAGEIFDKLKERYKQANHSI